MVIVVGMKYWKETRNFVVFHAEDESVGVPSIYVRKDKLEDLGKPHRLAVTVTVEASE